jgi:hypothetical protein
MKSFHKSNFGRFGESLPCDMDGYVHLTINDWMLANVDFGSDTLNVKAKRKWAREQVKITRKAVSVASTQLSNWQKG